MIVNKLIIVNDFDFNGVFEVDCVVVDGFVIFIENINVYFVMI